MSLIPALMSRKPRQSRVFKATADRVARSGDKYPTVLATWINHLRGEGLLTHTEAQELLSRLPKVDR